MAAEAPIVIRRVRRDGTIDVLGEWRPASKELVLNQPGFPLTPPGTHHIDGDLPWVFDEMAPNGYLAMRFADDFPELSLPMDRNLWSPGNVSDVLARHGGDLSGNLVLGDESFREIAIRSPDAPVMSQEDFEGFYPSIVDLALETPIHSSVGGSRPKLVVQTEDGGGAIVKFTPPLSTMAGVRWADLLRLEMHTSAVLRTSGIDAVESRYLEIDDRGYLQIRRFDRFAGGGREGHVTLFHLGAALYGEVTDPAPVIAGLVQDGHITEVDAARFRRVHDFSKAIANDDTHLGNYGLLIDDDGKARLAPAYDVLPMAFAPKHDELPDRLVKHTGPRDPGTNRLVERLIAAVTADSGISGAFREAWLRAVA